MGRTTAIIFSLNRIDTGDPSKPSGTSQLLLTLCSMLSDLMNFLTAELQCQCSLWYGRKRFLQLDAIKIFIICGLSMLADQADIAVIHVAAWTMSGCWNASTMCMTYLTDISSPDKANRNIGLGMVLPGFYGIIGLV